MQTVVFTNDIARVLDDSIRQLSPHGIFVLTDTNTSRLVWPLLKNCCASMESAGLIVIPAGDMNKNIESLSCIWAELQRTGANRHSLMVNLGGGMVTDIGGFAAATFKRGMKFINVPTTLLAAVDASVGGKTGINFGRLKSEVGAFREADSVIISTRMFATLPPEEMYSGYAEMIKHGLLDGDSAFYRLLDYDPVNHDFDRMLSLLEESVGVKRRVVAEDPFERGLRKALNLGHTAGHAFESLAMSNGAPVPHGYAVAWGLVVELVLSHMRRGFDSSLLRQLSDYVNSHYGTPDITCKDYPALIELMHHDKKNMDDLVNFTLLDAPGKIVIDCTAPDSEIEVALDIFRDLMHM